MSKINLLFIILVSIFLVSCQKDTEPVIIYDIQDEFKIQVLQDLSTSNEFSIVISTLDEYPSNYRIETGITLLDDKIELNIYRIVKDPNPSNQKRTITKKVKLGTLHPGSHPLNLILRNTIVNEGAISINPNKIELDFSTKHGISSKHFEVNRIPSNGYWGMAYIDDGNHLIFVDQFIKNIEGVSTQITNPIVGSYGYFSISDQGEINLPFPLKNFSKTFFMTSNDLPTVQNLVQQYKSYGIGFRAIIYTAQGEIFHHVSFDPPSSSLGQTLRRDYRFSIPLE